MQNLSAVDVLSIVLSAVALTITVVGFFASLKFYRDGVELQRKANDALTKLEEKTQFIQAQVGGMFDKTLDAAIGKREALAENFSELTAQLEGTRDKIIEAAVTQIGVAGEKERERLAQIVDNQMRLIRDKVETTKATVQDIAHEEDLWLSETVRPPNATYVFIALQKAAGWLTAEQLSARLGITPSIVKTILPKLESAGFIESVRTDKGTLYKSLHVKGTKEQ